MAMNYGYLDTTEERLRSLRRSKKKCKQEIISLTRDTDRTEALLKRLNELDREIRILQQN
jgi:GT2 family glycosyltransferase